MNVFFEVLFGLVDSLEFEIVLFVVICYDGICIVDLQDVFDWGYGVIGVFFVDGMLILIGFVLVVYYGDLMGVFDFEFGFFVQVVFFVVIVVLDGVCIVVLMFLDGVVVVIIVFGFYEGFGVGWVGFVECVVEVVLCLCGIWIEVYVFDLDIVLSELCIDLLMLVE